MAAHSRLICELEEPLRGTHRLVYVFLIRTAFKTIVTAVVWSNEGTFASSVNEMGMGTIGVTDPTAVKAQRPLMRLPAAELIALIGSSIVDPVVLARRRQKAVMDTQSWSYPDYSAAMHLPTSCANS